MAWSDPYGLRPDTIQLQVVRTGPTQFHTSIRIAPDDGGTPFTLGAGPRSVLRALKPGGGATTLKSDRNRKGDTGQQKATFTLDPGPQGDAGAIKKLLAQDKAYQDALPYELEPEAGDGNYNSNSYTAGMLNAAGIAVPFCMNYFTPGFEKPVPAKYFR